MDAMEALAEALRRVGQRKLLRYEPYPWQREFHDAGSYAIERMLMAANRVGKTMSAAAEVAMHASGQYPDWWQGKRFQGKVLVWVGAVTNESSRDIVQKELLGGTGENIGTGMIPGEKIEKVRFRQAGVGDVVDSVRVRHAKGGVSEITFKTYDQGWKKWQGAAPHVVWLDEEADDHRLYTEARTRVMTSRGILMVTFTPLQGETPLVLHFMNGDGRKIYLKTATWEDAPHLSEEDKADILASYPDYEAEARAKGIPMMGEGRVFTTSEEDFKVPERPIPRHWKRIKGIDFGIAHPAAVSDLAWDVDEDVIYVTRVWRKSSADVEEHAQAIIHETPWMPVSWPHDGEQMKQTDKGNIKLKELYRNAGVKLLGMTARYKKETGGAQPVEPIIIEMQQRLTGGSFKVFDSCGPFFEEYRSYHRKDGKIVAVRDDVLKSVMYAMMMKRYAVPEALARGRSSSRSAYSRPVVGAR